MIYGTTERFGYNKNPLAQQLQANNVNSLSAWGMEGLDNIPEIPVETTYDAEADESENYINNIDMLKSKYIEAAGKGININNPQSPIEKEYAKQWWSLYYDNVNKGKMLSQSQKLKEEYAKYLNDPNTLVKPLPKGAIMTPQLLNESVYRFDPQTVNKLMDIYGKKREMFMLQGDLEGAVAEQDKAVESLNNYLATVPENFRPEIKAQLIDPAINSFLNPILDNYKQQKLELQKQKQDFDQSYKGSLLELKKAQLNNSIRNTNIKEKALNYKMTGFDEDNYMDWITDVKSGSKDALELLLNSDVNIDYEDINGIKNSFDANVSKVVPTTNGIQVYVRDENGKHQLVKTVEPNSNSEMIALFKSAGKKYMPPVPTKPEQKPQTGNQTKQQTQNKTKQPAKKPNNLPYNELN